MTVNDLISATLTLVNTLGVGDSVAIEDSMLALNTFNMLLGSWNAAVKKSLAASYDSSLYTFNQVAAFVNLSDTITLPNGWTRALMYVGGMDLLRMYGRQISPDFAAVAADAKAAILTPAGTPAGARE